MLSQLDIKVGAQKACETIWNLTTMSGDELLNALKKTQDCQYDDRRLFLEYGALLAAANHIVEARCEKPEMRELLSGVECGKHPTDLFKQQIRESEKSVCEWLKDFRINAKKHPDLWDVAAAFLGRVLRGEVRDDKPNLNVHPNVPEAMKTMNDVERSENIMRHLWQIVWERQKNRLECS